jgi:hypothetical protein
MYQNIFVDKKVTLHFHLDIMHTEKVLMVFIVQSMVIS